PVFAHWDGSGWHFVPAAKFESTIGAPGVGALSGSSSTDLWAVGGTRGGDALMHWDGRRWTAFRISEPRTARYSTTDVAVVTRRDAWLVSPPAHWDGRRWTRA